MNPRPSPRPTFFRTVWLLLRMARQRARGRAERQRQLFRQRRKKESLNFGVLAFPILILVGVAIHVGFAFGLVNVLAEATTVDLERSGRIFVGYRVERALDAAAAFEREWTAARGNRKALEGKRREVLADLEAAFRRDSNRHRAAGQSPDARYAQLQKQFAARGPAGFSGPIRAFGSLAENLRRHPGLLPALAGLAMLAWWFAMITFQGEGLDLDVQRQRHPMWEWLLSHPVKPGAVFFAEMLAPLAANPNVILAPVFWIALLALSGNGLLASIVPGLLLGLPLAVAAACINKTIEINALLRLAPRNRGAILGFMSWIGYIATAGVFLLLVMHGTTAAILRWIAPFVPAGDSPLVAGAVRAFSGWSGMALAVGAVWLLSALAVTVSVGLSGRATIRGLAGASGGRPRPAKILSGDKSAQWLGDALYRKELLWFWRDRGAVVQAILIPMSVAAFQLVNLRGLFEQAVGQWHLLCTVAVVFGTYFLFILGPRSLVSEGAALWIPLTWPRGMESLLRAKARLWWMLSNVPVALGLLLAMALFPREGWKIFLVGLGWWAFSRSLALKSVTLVQTPNSSGEPEPLPAGRRYAAWLGTFTFASGIASQQWHLAAVGVVYSWMSAAAMWQNFRTRLPYLFDPWSEPAIRPPAVMHAMIAILAMTELVSVVSAFAFSFGGARALWMTQAIAYGVTALITWLITRKWLADRDVPDAEIWNWRDPAAEGLRPRWGWLPLGALAGAALGFGAWAYLGSLSLWWPQAAEILAKNSAYLSGDPAQWAWFAFLAVVCAPLAEEYLFRGLLYRALDREWGGWRAIAGSAAFFAIYHPLVSWVPVIAVGVLNAWLFRRSRRLWPCVAAHAAYNLVVVLR